MERCALLKLLLLALLSTNGVGFPEHGLKACVESDPVPEPVAEPEPAPQEHAEISPSQGAESEKAAAESARLENAAVVVGAPRNAEECRRDGGECLPAAECPNAKFRWNQPFEGICEQEGYECCFRDISQHAATCGAFGGDCTEPESCGAAPRYSRARCAKPGQVCCIWLF